MFDLREELDILESKGLRRKLSLLESVQAEEIIIEGKNCLNLCSNNYLGLASEPRLKAAAIEAIKNYGLGSGASRLVCGNHRLYKELEEKIAEFKETPSSLVFNSGYAANLGIISVLVDEKDIVFSDKLNHASIIDGILLSRAKFRRYPHKDIEALEAMLKDSGNFRRRLIVTDTVFSMDGDIAPLTEIVELARKYNAKVMVDEAHATGVFGKSGRGIVEHFNLKNEIFIQMGTLSKAIGCLGAYVCAGKDTIDYLINKARSLIYTTALPPAILAASIKAVEIIQQEPERRKVLFENAEFFRSNLRRFGLNTLDSQSPIIPVVVGRVDLAVEFSKRLFNEGIFCPAIRPPTVPKGDARLRMTVMATHKKEHLEFALEKIKKIAKDLGLL
ncbi:MAG: 8-amino-7-oxononanoate synthase [Candidatus Omnitrophica bacterium]|nr:8-amino-7-oxononanoate synthase [Candidatus Omnitrophota bacterium]